jgi:AbiV family abortive infection protein
VITASHLLEGSVYALEQCGLLLRDALCLYRSGSYSTAVALAALAREELGKSILLCNLRDRVLAGGSVTDKDLNNALRDHEGKQKQAVQGFAFSEDDGSGLSAAVIELQKHTAATPEWHEASARIEALVDQRLSKYAKERHATRMACLYVDRDQAGTGWRRPAHYDRTQAFCFLLYASRDYSVLYHQIESGTCTDAGREFADAVRAWTERPTLSPPEWPKS